MELQILLVEGKRRRDLSCGPLLEKKGYPFDCAHTRRTALKQVEENQPALLIVDARTLRFDAHRFCQTLRENGNQVPLLLVLPEGEKGTDSGATIVLQGNVTSRRFFNRVKRLLSEPGGEVLRVGDLVLDVKQQTVSKGKQRYRLTPKQTRLLEVFMRNPGRVLTRSFLMKEVWKTDFVDDTRTLEVHVHWLRKAIEENPKSPAYLVTVRRLGYRFDVPKPDSSSAE